MSDTIFVARNVRTVKAKEGQAKRLSAELKLLGGHNPALFDVVSHLNAYSQIVIGKPLVITCIWRSSLEQQAIYGKDTSKVSPHQRWMAVDLRSAEPHLNAEQRKVLEKALRKCDSSNKLTAMPNGSRTVWIHAVGKHGLHFHVQYKGDPIGLKFQLPSNSGVLARTA